jgi:hypothetical protein
MGTRKKRLRKAAGVPVVIGVAWYSPSQWARLREVSADPELLEQTHQEWVATYERTTRDLAATGMMLRKVPIDVAELEKWCRERKKPIDGSARAEYVLEIVQRDHATLDVVSPNESALR